MSGRSRTSYNPAEATTLMLWNRPFKNVWDAGDLSESD